MDNNINNKIKNNKYLTKICLIINNLKIFNNKIIICNQNLIKLKIINSYNQNFNKIILTQIKKIINISRLIKTNNIIKVIINNNKTIINFK